MRQSEPHFDTAAGHDRFKSPPSFGIGCCFCVRNGRHDEIFRFEVSIRVVDIYLHTGNRLPGFVQHAATHYRPGRQPKGEFLRDRQLRVLLRFHIGEHSRVPLRGGPDANDLNLLWQSDFRDASRVAHVVTVPFKTVVVCPDGNVQFGLRQWFPRRIPHLDPHFPSRRKQPPFPLPISGQRQQAEPDSQHRPKSVKMLGRRRAITPQSFLANHDWAPLACPE
jgi:hypothetical protein